MVREPHETDEQFRKRHIQMRPPMTLQELGPEQDIEDEINLLLRLSAPDTEVRQIPDMQME